MHTPTRSQWQTVIDNLEKVLPLAQHKNHLDMMEARVNKNHHLCGTTHCLGGWYAIATLDTNTEIDFTDGADRMAKDLGLENRLALGEWARLNPKIWGNHQGCYIFCDASAFKWAQSLSEIVEFLKDVRDRSPK